jgi:hypothetical protein
MRTKIKAEGCSNMKVKEAVKKIGEKCLNG